ncbi:NAD(P)-dependent oxidoreductase [Halovulum dunhuangense]|uniref:NAD(P)-dependent oxidoreductase n=1 Tax=Halovulum dunhuangense TaxID=1505036 RepID=A0A849L7L4_9RHOB|nr:NAD(P)-dependent oxidoreductase [Halovulum dunhuangense]NNU82047.1 NAD(P)-dependent oxidoreductase [Halovulum dunhuangense]
MKIGFIGLGRMGAEMALNLSRAGHDLTVWNRTSETSRNFAAESGAAIAASPAELCAQSELVITMLSNDAASEEVHFARDGLFSVSGPKTVIEMGTMTPGHIRRLIGHAPAGFRVIDAPVSGSVQAARDGALLIMVGCTPEELTELAPVFGCMGKQSIALGAPGQAAIMKLAVNGLIHGLNQAVAEAIVLVERAGIDPALAFDIIESSAAAAPMLSYRRPLYLAEADHAVTFTVSLARKDMEAMARLAEDVNVAIPQARVTLQKLHEAEGQGFGDRDMASILAFMRKERT